MATITRFIYAVGLLAAVSLLQVTSIWAADKPSLANEIRQTLEASGVEAARQRFAEIYPERRDEFDIDMQTLGNLGAEYMKAGNMDAGMAVIEMTTTISQAMIAQMMQGEAGKLAQELSEAQAAHDEAAQHTRAAENNQPEQERAASRGPARDDLDGFVGLYANPAQGESGRRLWVQKSCDGYLVAGAMWGDASPWWLKSEGDLVFAVSTNFQSLRADFEPNDTMKMHHDLEFMASPLLRTGPLPVDWETCIERR
jgi:hypothetical protein